jgi:hypothetical protein
MQRRGIGLTGNSIFKLKKTSKLTSEENPKNMTLVNIAPQAEKNFFGKEFSVSFTLHSRGNVSGTLCHYSEGLVFKKSFDGLYYIEGSKIKLGFIIEWEDANLSSKTLTAFSGSILSYKESHQCLVLRWLKVIEPLTSIGSTVDQHIALLFDSPEKNPHQKASVFLRLLPTNSQERITKYQDGSDHPL